MNRMTIADFHAACGEQGVPGEHIAVKCPVCGTIQSLADLKSALAKATREHLLGHFESAAPAPELHLGFSCVGRFSGSGEWRGAQDLPGRGCNWSLGGFLKLHKLEIVTTDGQRHPTFELATPEEAQAHMRAKELANA